VRHADRRLRNLPDGRVEVEASGAAKALDEFAREIADGPHGARIEHVEMTEIEPFKTSDGFRIR
jgi:acylphosphatase